MAILCTVFSPGQSKSMQTTCSNAATGYLINCFAEGDTIHISTTPLYHQKIRVFGPPFGKKRMIVGLFC